MADRKNMSKSKGASPMGDLEARTSRLTHEEEEDEDDEDYDEPPLPPSLQRRINALMKIHDDVIEIGI